MYLKHLEIKGFRNYSDSSVSLESGVSVVVGKNGAGKTSLLEAAQYSICGRSFRTSKDSEMIKDGSEFLRLRIALEQEGVDRNRLVSLKTGGPAIVDQGGGARWEEPGSVLCFSPDDLQLVKGAPAERRRFLNEAISLRHPAYSKLARDYRKVLSQRNSFLHRARAGIVRLSDISPWDRQLMALAFQIYDARADYCRDLSPAFKVAYGEIAGGETEVGINYRSQLGKYDDDEDREEAATRELEQTWSSDLERGASGIGTHRDDVEFLLAGKSLRVYGSQGEQRSAVLSLLLAEAGNDNGRHQPLLLLDDVLSELDPERRGHLLAALGNGLGSQVIITATDSNLIPAERCNDVAVLEIGPGGLVIEKERAGV